jgi:hypothetical protein
MTAGVIQPCTAVQANSVHTYVCRSNRKNIRFILPNVDKLDFRSAISMNTKYMFVVAAMAVMLVGATAFATDSAFADGKKHYDKNQAVSQANACGNGELPLNVFCQNIDSQVQGEENAVSATGSQGIVPEEEPELIPVQ